MSKIARPIPQIQADNTTSLTDVNVLDLASTTEVYCRICFIEESSEQLLRPCNCKGTIGDVHLSCLERWINYRSIAQCELCQYRFKYQSIRRYTMWRSLLMCEQYSDHPRSLRRDVFALVLLIVSFIYMETLFIIEYSRDSPNDRILRGVSVWITVILFHSLIIWILLMCIAAFIQGNVRPWYTWWQNCTDIRLIREQQT